MQEMLEGANKGESPAQFAYRMQREGFVLEYVKPTGCAGISDQEFVYTVIQYLNERAGTAFQKKMTGANAKLILSQRKAGFSLEDFKTVIDKKCFAWLGKAYEEALMPETLFSRRHFENYLGQKRTHAAQPTTASSTGDYAKLTASAAAAKRPIPTGDTDAVGTTDR